MTRARSIGSSIGDDLVTIVQVWAFEVGMYVCHSPEKKGFC
jgi:hypothetical protein